MAFNYKLYGQQLEAYFNQQSQLNFDIGCICIWLWSVYFSWGRVSFMLKHVWRSDRSWQGGNLQGRMSDGKLVGSELVPPVAPSLPSVTAGSPLARPRPCPSFILFVRSHRNQWQDIFFPESFDHLCPPLLSSPLPPSLLPSSRPPLMSSLYCNEGYPF